MFNDEHFRPPVLVPGVRRRRGVQRGINGVSGRALSTRHIFQLGRANAGHGTPHSDECQGTMPAKKDVSGNNLQINLLLQNFLALTADNHAN
jgi:hypothetical protein